MGKKLSALAEWRTGWPYVVTNDFGQMAIVIQTYTTGIFMKPLAAQFGWSRAEVSGAMVTFAIGMFLFAPLAGSLIDKYGARRIGLIGAPLTGLAIASVGLSGPSIWGWYAAWSAYAIFSLLMGPQVWAAAISRHFNVSRGFALAVGFSGNGLGAILWPGFTVWLMSHYGWRAAYFGLGGSVVIGLTLACYVLMRGPAAMRTSTATQQAAKIVGAGGKTLREAFKSSTFWRVSLMMMMMAAGVASVLVHLPALLTDKGMTPGQAAEVMALMGPAVIVGRLTGGFLLDRIPGRFVMMVMFLCPAAACLTLIGYDGGYARAVVAALLMGITNGVEGDLIAFLVSRYFGVRNFGAIYGAALSIFAIGYGLAPALAGGVFDHFGSYDPGLMGLAVALLICVPVTLTLGAYPKEEDDDEAANHSPLPSAASAAAAE